jgi:ferredoxin
VGAVAGSFYEGQLSMPKVVFVNEKKEIEVPEGANLRQEATKAEIQVYRGLDKYLNCRGNGLCGTCRVLVKKGMENLSRKGWLERFKLATMLSAIGHEDEMRLSCQVRINGDCTIETRPPFNFSGENFWQKPYPNK